MARWTYQQMGVFLPIERDEEENLRVIRDARVLQNDDFMNDGFLFVRALQMGFSRRPLNVLNILGEKIKLQSVFVVQSVSTGELFLNKLLDAEWDPDTQLSLPPLELRSSTYRHDVGDPNIDILSDDEDDDSRKGILPDVPYFNKLRFWQELDPDDPTDPNLTVYSLFFEFCNGGSLSQLMEKYHKRATAIPEHFMWLVAEQLFSALVTMEFGNHPARDDQDGLGPEPNDWARIYHRDLHKGNVFINYPIRGRGRIPDAGLEGNAFPEIVVGDFGNSGIEGDDLAILPISAYGEWEEDGGAFLEDWEDIYSVGEILRDMSMTHIPVTGMWDEESRPNCRWVEEANRDPRAPPYSDELIELLQRFEYPNQVRSKAVMSLGDAVHTTFPSPEDLRDTLLPQAQARVLGFRRPPNRPAGYFDGLDVSWTKPEQLVPFSYNMRYAAEARDEPAGGSPSAQDGNDAESEQGDGASNTGQNDLVQQAGAAQQPQGSEHPGGADDDDHGDNESSPLPPARPPPPTPEQRAMRELGKLHNWDRARPQYELRCLDFRVPTILPFKHPP